MYCSGTVTSTAMIGSSSAGLHSMDALLERHRGGDLERQLVRVDRVERAVVERRLEVGQRIAGKDALGGRLADALLDAREEALRHRPADDPLGELDAAAGVRLELDPDVAEHAVAAGLLLVLALDLGLAADRLPVRDLRRPGHDRGPELALEPLGDDRDVGLADRDAGAARRSATARPARDGSSSSIRWRAAPILSRSAFVCGSIATDEGRLREVDRAAGRAASPSRERVAGLGHGQLGDGPDLAGLELADRLLVLAVEEQELADPLVLAAVRVPGVALRRGASRRGPAGRSAGRRTGRPRS